MGNCLSRPYFAWNLYKGSWEGRRNRFHLNSFPSIWSEMNVCSNIWASSHRALTLYLQCTDVVQEIGQCHWTSNQTSWRPFALQMTCSNREWPSTARLAWKAKFLTSASSEVLLDSSSLTQSCLAKPPQPLPLPSLSMSAAVTAVASEAHYCQFSLSLSSVYRLLFEVGSTA